MNKNGPGGKLGLFFGIVDVGAASDGGQQVQGGLQRKEFPKTPEGGFWLTKLRLDGGTRFDEAWVGRSTGVSWPEGEGGG